MKKWVRISLYLIVGAFIVIQFFRPERNQGNRSGEGDLIAFLQVPENLTQNLKNSCYDCHSNQTAYPWYSQISPVSWLLGKHIREGKEELNFSEFGNLEKKEMIGKLTEICEVLEEGSMPLPDYLFIHRDAALSEEEADALCEWAEIEAMKLLRD
jgi:hypothetical protein